ncbi:MAG: PAS domain S-box protein [Planctomycetes bacterium]|nr:PAS domain S-box protein [Planctomycetota bacterium]
MHAARGQPWRNYGLALFAIAIAAALRVTCEPFLQHRATYAFFSLAVMFAGRYAGFGPSCLALGLGCLGSIGVFYFRAGAIDVHDQIFQGGMIAYWLLGIGIVLLSRGEWNARGAAEQSAAEALRQQRILEHEVSERAELEHQLRERQQHLELTLQAGRLGLWSWDLRTGLVQSSATQQLIHGRSPAQRVAPIGASDENIHPEDRELVRRAIETAVSDNAEKKVTYRVIWPDGGIHWVEASGQVMRDATGQPIRVLGVCADITDSKQRELRLRAAETQFRQLAEQAPVGIAQGDLTGHIFFVNRQWCELSGCTPDEAMGLGWISFIHADDRNQVVTLWREVISAGEDFQSPEFRVTRKDGSIRWAVASAKLFYDDQGQPLGQIGMVLDITDRRLAQDELRATHARLQAILDNTTAVMYVKGTDGRYLLVNRQYVDVIKILPDDILGKTDEETFPPELAAQFVANDKEVIRLGEPLVFEEVAPHRDGEHHYISVKFPIKDATGKVLAMGGISTDISELKRTTEALRAERELLRNLIEVQESEKQFISYEVHDGLIQYVAGTMMSLEGYQRSHPAQSASDVIPRAIANLRRAVDEGRRIIRGVRTTVLNDYGVIAAIEDLIDQLADSGIAIEFTHPATIDRLSRPLETAIYRVAQEALNNARRHSGTRRVRVELQCRAAEIALAVQDFGAGFDIRAVPSSAFGVRGMRERIRLLGGSCSIESTIGKGTRVEAVLPIAPNGDE